MRAAAVALLIALASPALAQPKGGGGEAADRGEKDVEEPDDEGARSEARARTGGREKLFDFTGLELDGTMRMPQLLYFLERAQQELERASLERRSFIPEMVRTLDEEPL